jgi:WD40 repeat protein/transcriptional regulator with XRE-family HTH domain
MVGTHHDEPRDYSFGALALMLRERVGLTQQELAALAGVSERAIQTWEAGESYPSAESLKRLIAAYLDRGMFAAGREAAEAAALWAAVPQHAVRRRKVPFDRTWFASLLARRPAEGGAVEIPPMVLDSPDPALDGVWSEEDRRSAVPRREDWGEAPDSSLFHGRTDELDRLTRWVVAERCRLIALLGMGGIGKTCLAARLTHTLATRFDCIFWRSLANALPFDEWLGAAIRFLSAQQQAVLPGGVDARLGLLLDLLRARRCLLVLDNWETVLHAGEPVARCRDGYEGYGLLLKRLAEAPHQSCLVLTSRESPHELVPLAGTPGAARAHRLRGLAAEEGRAMLQDKALAGDLADWDTLVARFGGNALALRVVGETIAALFGGDIAAFLAEPAVIFGDLRQLLDGQRARLSPLERSLLYWLAIAREPVTVGGLATNVSPTITRAGVCEGVEALLRRSLVDAGEGGCAFSLPPAVQEYVTERLIEDAHEEIANGRPALLCSHALVKATARDYVRRSQERVIAMPLLERLTATCGDAKEAERRLAAMLHGWRDRAHAYQGYGPGNVVNLLRLLRGNLRDLDLSRLAIRHVYLQGVEAQDTSLAGAYLSGAVLTEAFSYPTSVALSVDDAYLAAGTSAGQVLLWRVADRSALLSVQGHTGMVYAVALSRDGRVLVSGSQDGTVKLWEVPNGRLRASLLGHTGVVYGVAFSDDGRLVASGSHDGTVKLWEAPSGRLLATLQGHTAGIWSVALSGDGRLLASGSQDGTVKLWEAPRSRLGESSVAGAAASLPAGNGRSGGEQGQLLATLQGHTAGIWSVALSGDGRLLASGSQDGTAMLWEVPSGRLLTTLQGHTSGVRGVALSGDGRLLASGSYDGTLKIWETSSGRLLATLQGHTGVVLAVALQGLVASGSFDGSLRLWEAPSGRLVATLQGHTGGIQGVAFSTDGRLLASGGQDGTVRLWDASGGRLRATLRGHTGGVQGLALSGDRRLLASASNDGTIKLWEVSSGRLLASLQGHTGVVWGVALSGDGHLVASGSYDGTARLWEAPGGRLLATLQGHTGLVFGVALSADGRLVASGSFDETVKLWEAPSGRPLATLQGHHGGIYSVALSGDGRLVASGSTDGTVRLWEAPSGRLLAILQGHTGAVWGVAISCDGRIVASASFDGTVRLWAAPSGRPLASLQGHTRAVYGVALSGDGRLVASGSFDGTARLWGASAVVAATTREGDAYQASRSAAPESITCLRTVRPDRLYERMDITGLSGITDAQRAALIALGAMERGTTAWVGGASEPVLMGHRAGTAQDSPRQDRVSAPGEHTV